MGVLKKMSLYPYYQDFIIKLSNGLLHNLTNKERVGYGFSAKEREIKGLRKIMAECEKRIKELEQIDVRKDVDENE